VEQLANASGAYDYRPNIVLTHLGTNDCLPKARESISTIADRFESLLASIKAHDASTLVIASTLIHNLDPSTDDCITNFNAHLPDVVQAARDGGQKVVLVDMHDAVPRRDINRTDGTHPTDEGYQIMANVWYQGLQNASSLIGPPDATGKNVTSATSSHAGLASETITWYAPVLLLLSLIMY
jgi:lysophospholipase L1-like esterase